jgi:hypothetical protein
MAITTASAGGAEQDKTSFPLSIRELNRKLPFGLHGFWEARVGTRLQSDDAQEKTGTLGETRLQVDLDKFFDWGETRLKTDFVRDWILNEWNTDVREANVLLFTPFADIKVGRHVLTWGTGDLIFINDLFPKDWQAFFIGRDVEYLKAPSDAVKASFFTDVVNFDIVYTPQFDPDRFTDGERLSLYNPLLGRITGEENRVNPIEPDDWLEDDEIALRVYKNIRGYELALYGYHGFWKTPVGSDPATGRATYPDLSVYGASARGTVGPGIGNVEVGYYDSRDDRDGDDPFIRNSELRFLLGYTQDVPEIGGKDFTIGLQYYLEYMMDHESYLEHLPPGMPAADEDRHLTTLRLTKLLWNQNLTLSLFTFLSPSDGDAHLRPKAHYKVTDQWGVELGANIFLGKDDHTLFGQYEDNSNVYTGVRWSF